MGARSLDQTYRIVRMLCWGLALCLAGEAKVARAASGGGELVFDNTRVYLTNFFTSSNEFGDEIRLTTGPAELTSFSFEYFGDFVPTGMEGVRLRFYLNDGVDVDPRPDKVISAPGTVRYESGLIPIAPGFNAVSVLGLNVVVPASFTWTVEFTGVSIGGGAANAGLLFFNPPSLGASFDDFWQRVNGTWGLYRFAGNPVANFGARALSRTETPLAITETNVLANGTVQLKIQGPPGRGVNLEYSADAVKWTSIATLTLTNRVTEYLDTTAPAAGRREYRVSLLHANAVAMQFHGVRATSGGGTSLRYTGQPGEFYELQASPDMQQWQTVFRGVFGGEPQNHTDAAPVAARRFFRLRSGPQLASEFNVEATYPVNKVFQIGLNGPPGRHVVIEASADLMQWQPLSTNQFSFASGAITLVDAKSPQEGRRFYRAVPLPGP